MLWDELLAMTEVVFAEDIDASDAFLKKANIKYEMAVKQMLVSRQVKCLEHDGPRQVQLERNSTILNPLPRDFIQMLAMRYEDQIYLDQGFRRPTVTQYPDSTPSHFFIQENKFGLYGAISGDQQMTLRETNVDSIGATFSVDSTKVTITIHQGANNGASTYTFAANATITAMVAAINTASIGVTATAVNGSDASSTLETVTRRNMHGIIASAYEGTALNCNLWYHRVAPPYAFRLIDTASGGSAATYTVTDTKVTIIITGGANAGTYNYPFVTYPTMDTMVQGINIENVGVKAVLHEQCPNDKDTKGLEEMSATTFFGLSTTKMYLDPEIPDEMQRNILVEYGMHIARQKDRDYAKSNNHMALEMKWIQYYKKHWKDRFMSMHNDSYTDEYAYGDTGFAPLGRGGYVVIP